jgi:hypothetical protein
MNQKQQVHASNPSRLEQFSLDFEYDRSYGDIKREVRVRTIDYHKT